MNDAALMVEDDDDLLIVARPMVDERGVSKLAADWWGAYTARLIAQREAIEALDDRRGAAVREQSIAARARQARNRQAA